jgi:hypothetical protein
MEDRIETDVKDNPDQGHQANDQENEFKHEK